MQAELSWTASGQGLPLVLLHGFPFDSTIWQTLDGLDRVARVLTPDLPGFGDSAPLPVAPEAATIEAYARAVLAWADGLRLDSFALAGHSMGGYVALALAHLAPHRLAGLILICSKAAPDTEEGAAGRHKLAAAVGEEGPQAVVDAMLSKLFAPGASLSVRETTRAVMLRQAVPGIQAALYAMASRPDSRPRLPTLPTPTLIVAGADDGIIPPAVAQETRDGLRNAAYVEIPSAGHMPMLEAPDVLIAALAPFVAGLTPPIVVPPGS
jgi:pimeloyl-ACP methyl ester carboxylesterase